MDTIAPTIRFKAKLVQVYSLDGSPAYQVVKVPEFTRVHCDMDAFRKHRRYGVIANSDLFPGALRGIRKKVAPFGSLRLDRLPKGVQVDTSQFLAVVTIDVDRLNSGK